MMKNSLVFKRFKKLIRVGDVGLRNLYLRKGVRRKKTVRGSIISSEIVSLNLIILNNIFLKKDNDHHFDQKIRIKKKFISIDNFFNTDFKRSMHYFLFKIMFFEKNIHFNESQNRNPIHESLYIKDKLIFALCKLISNKSFITYSKRKFYKRGKIKSILPKLQLSNKKPRLNQLIRRTHRLNSACNISWQ